MAEPDVNPEVLEHLRSAERSRPLLEAAGVPLRRWESYCLAFTEPALLKGEFDRLSDGGGDGKVNPELLKRLDSLRADIDPLLEKLRSVVLGKPATPEKAEMDEMILGFIAGSPAARQAASKWLSNPDKYAEEALLRLGAIETFVSRYRAKLREVNPPPAETGIRRRKPDAPAPTPAEPPPPPKVEAPPPPPPPPPLTAPDAVRADPYPGRVVVSWGAVPGAARYAVERAPVAGGSWERVSTPDATSFVDAGLERQTRFRYRVSAIAAGGESAPSPVVEGAPLGAPTAPPMNVRAEALDARVKLAWDAVAGCDKYRVMRSLVPGGPYSAVANPAETGWTDSDVQNGTAYHYVVRASNAAGKGPHSTEVRALPMAPPAAPGGLSAVAGNARVLLSWTPVAGASVYVVRRAEAAEGPFHDLASTPGATLVDVTVLNGRTYHYQVGASGPGGSSPAGATASAAPVAPPAAPAEFRATAEVGRIRLGWSPVPGAEGYHIRRGEFPLEALAPLATVAQPALDDDTAEPGTPYHYAVSAFNAGGDGPLSDGVHATAKTAPPAAPAGLKGTGAGGRARLEWPETERATGYILRRASDPAGPFEAVAHLHETSFRDDHAAPGATWHYSVTAVNEGGESPPSAAVAVVPVAPPPPPAGLRAAASGGQVALTWEPAPAAERYVVRRAPEDDGPWSELAAVGGTAYIDATVEPGRRYGYRVASANDGGEGEPSAPVSAVALSPAPAAPATLQALPGNARVQLSWEAADGALDYFVRRASAAEGPFVLLATVPGTRYADESAANGVLYFYAVSAGNPGGESAPTPPVAATPIAPPGAPGGVTANAGGGQVRLDWDPVPGAEGYVVWRAGDKDGEPAAVAHVRETTFTDTKVVDGTTYLYSLIAVNSSGDSPASHLVSATPRSAPPAPAGLTGTTGDGQVSIRWDAADGAAAYRVKRASNREGPYETVGQVETTSFSDTGVVNGTTYFYIVRAVSPAGKSPYSARLRATPRAKPPAPADVAAVLRDGSAVLSWKAVDKAQGYRIQRAVGDADFALAGTTRQTAWTDKGPADPATRWRVTSVVNGAESDPSAPVTAAAPEAAPTAPSTDTDQVPTLESIVAPSFIPETLPPGVDVEKLEDLKRVEHLRRVFQDTGQKFDPWEVLTLLAEEGKGTRKDIEIVLRLREQNKQEQFTTGALSLFERILKVRSAHGGFVRKLREYIGALEIPGASASALEIALGFLISAPKGRARAAQWLAEPEKRKPEAAGFLGHALDLARSYVGAMQAGEED